LTEDDKDNEVLKLVASLINTVAGSVITVGTLVPIGQLIYGILPNTVESGLVYSSAVICIAIGLSIHLVGHLVLKGLQ
jgi:hypothetical protein